MLVASAVVYFVLLLLVGLTVAVAILLFEVKSVTLARPPERVSSERGSAERYSDLLRSASAARNPESLLETLCSTVADSTGSVLICFITCDKEHGTYQVRARSRTEEVLSGLVDKLSLGVGKEYLIPPGSVLRSLLGFDAVKRLSQVREYLCHYLSDSDADRAMSDYHIHSLSVFPVWCGGVRRGAVIAFQTSESSEEVLLRWIAAQCGVILCYLEHIESLKDRERQDHQSQQFRKMEAIGRLAGGIAHDFNNLLSGISGYASMIKRKYPDDPKLVSYVDPIIAASQKAADLTGQLLAFARRGAYQPSEIDSNALINSLSLSLTGSLGSSIQVRSVPNSTACTLIGDRSQIENAIVNLANNSRDAMPHGGILTLSTETVRVGEDQQGKDPVAPGLYVVITVSDTGTGMDKETQARMFEPFFTTKEKGKGTGLGLASVYGCISNHNGHIQVESSPGRGTSVRMFLPGIERVVQSVHEERKSSRSSGPQNLLIVDDEPVVRSVCKEMLEDLGYKVVECCDGLDAVEFFKNHGEQISLAIIDMIMPRMGGYECVKELRKIKPDLKIVISTGYSIAQDTQQVITAGISAYLQKPFEQAELSRIVSEVLTSCT